jgi:integrase
MAQVKQRSNGRWSVRIRRTGWPVQTRTFRTRADADAWARAVEREMDTNSFIPRDDAERTSFASAAQRYIAEVLPRLRGKVQTEYLIKRLVGVFGTYSLASITSALLASYRDERLKAVSPQSVVHELGMISRIYKVAAMDWGMALPRGNPVALVRKPPLRNERERRLVDNEEELLSAALRTCKHPYPHTAFVLAVETAARQSELIALTWEDINLHARVARIRGKNGGVTKNGDTFRDVPLSTRAVNTLKALPLPRSGSVLRMSQNSLKLAWQRAVCRARQNHLHEMLRQRLTAAGLSAAEQEREIRALVFRKRTPSPRTNQLLKDLETSDKTLAELKFHDLRHEATSRLAERLEMHELMKVTGHKTSRTLVRYYHPRAADLAKKLA